MTSQYNLKLILAILAIATTTNVSIFFLTNASMKQITENHERAAKDLNLIERKVDASNRAIDTLNYKIGFVHTINHIRIMDSE